MELLSFFRWLLGLIANLDRVGRATGKKRPGPMQIVCEAAIVAGTAMRCQDSNNGGASEPL
jgi:hypothetical protein